MLLKNLILVLLLFSTPIFAKDVYVWKENGVYKYGDEKPDVAHTIIPEENAKKLIESFKNPESPKRSAKAIRTTMKSYSTTFFGYLEERRNETFKGKITLRFEVAPNGSVASCFEDYAKENSTGFNGKACEILANFNFGEFETENTEKVTYSMDIN